MGAVFNDPRGPRTGGAGQAQRADIVPRVYTGSANFTHQENSDDSLVRIKGRAVHDDYVEWFWALRAACPKGPDA
ncbi:hypothetical protein Psi01_75030 [Planobispora siamensis]|uniref:Phospholipase D-like domain-containing protein n=2 Tax=Planobispora siamensis TaxID=936338 RepID=A0A8J3WP84_9ACTN|nr:hypothetical protein Psi01_75030 [Planobispora siamensis]